MPLRLCNKRYKPRPATTLCLQHLWCRFAVESPSKKECNLLADMEWQTERKGRKTMNFTSFREVWQRPGLLAIFQSRTCALTRAGTQLQAVSRATGYCSMNTEKADRGNNETRDACTRHWICAHLPISSQSILSFVRSWCTDPTEAGYVEVCRVALSDLKKDSTPSCDR